MWDKQDREIFNNSEVMREFEKSILEKIEKISQLKQQQDTVIQKNKEVTKSFKEVEDAAAKSGLTNPADDFENKSMFNEGPKIETSPIVMTNSDKDKEGEEKKAQLIVELQKLAQQEAKNKNFSSVYKIERTIQEIIDGDYNE